MANDLKLLQKKTAADALADTVSPDTPNVLQAMMQLRQAKFRAEAANKLALEEEKERDAPEKSGEELKRQLQLKRERTDDDAGDAHEKKLTEVDNWDLRDHRQQATRVQNSHNVQVGSRKNQAKTHTVTDGFLHHTRLGLVRLISFWCLGDSALTVYILVALIMNIQQVVVMSDMKI
jgi:hypothetical protein